MNEALETFFANPQIKIILFTAAASLTLALILGLLLGFFKKLFFVKTDPTIQAIRDALPGANCGGCGYPGCDGFADACAAGTAPANGCVAGGTEVTKALSSILGVEADSIDRISVLRCQGNCENAKLKGFYTGTKSCRGAKISTGGVKLCQWGCIGLGDCERVCPFGAITIGEKGLPLIDKSKCTGCGICVNNCPQKVLTLIPRDLKGAIALCSNNNPVKPAILKACKTGCIKCGKCEKNCPKNAISFEKGIPKIDYGLCDSCGTCVEGCPTKVLVLL